MVRDGRVFFLSNPIPKRRKNGILITTLNTNSQFASLNNKSNGASQVLIGLPQLPRKPNSTRIAHKVMAILKIRATIEYIKKIRAMIFIIVQLVIRVACHCTPPDSTAFRGETWLFENRNRFEKKTC